MSDVIPVNIPLLDGSERELLLECIQTGWISSEGPFVAKFEQKFANKVGRKYGIAVANGSGALDAAVAALRLEPGDEVILPSFTIISCAAAIVRAGAVPVVVDSDPSTWNMDASRIEERISRRTRAIMMVHVYGLPADTKRILEIASCHNLKVIEDAAQMHGQTSHGRPCGSFGDVSTFSFYPNKHITTGEGGMIVTDDATIAERCRSLRNLCFQPERRFVHEELGWNLRMTNLQAALGLAQLARLDEFVARKRAIGQRYMSLLNEVASVELPPVCTDYAENIYWVFGLVLKESVRFSASEAMQSLRAAGIGTRPFFWPMHEQPVFRRMGLFENEQLPVCERMARRGFYMPSGVGLELEQVDRAAQALKDILQ